MPDDLPAQTEVIVVGAGPAGASTAYHLARLGRRVLLLDQSSFPRDKSCGDAITWSGVQLLREMGVLCVLPSPWRTQRLRVTMSGQGTREFVHSRPSPAGAVRHGLVMPRLRLDAALVGTAVAAGAVLRERTQVRRLLGDSGDVHGVVLADGAELRANVVVAGDGAASRLAREAGLVATPPGGLGFAIRAYFDGVRHLDDALEFFMPLNTHDQRTRLPSYGWAFPTGPTTANMGVGIVERRPGVNMTGLFRRFVNDLRAVPQFSEAVQRGAVHAAPMRFDFAPDRSWAPGLVLVGDAAGMVSPFTGEGISYAIESGKLAAEEIDARLQLRSTADFSGYARRLAGRFGGYFEAGRHTTSRHKLAWQVLDDTFSSERPIFSLARRLALAPEGLAGHDGSGVLDDVRAFLPPELLIEPKIIEVGHILADTIRKEWPFMLRLHSLFSESLTGVLRPSLLVLLASEFGKPDRDLQIALAAAVELAGISCLAEASLAAEPGRPVTGRPNWGTKFAVLTADVLLARALALCASHEGELAVALCSHIEQICRQRMEELSAHRRERPRPWAETGPSLRTGLAALCGTACELGGALAAAPAEHAGALKTYGSRLGAAVQLSDDMARLQGGQDRLGRTALADLEKDDSSFPLLLLIEQRDPQMTEQVAALIADPGPNRARADELVSLVASANVLEDARKWVDRLRTEARQALDSLPDTPARRTLSTLASVSAIT